MHQELALKVVVGLMRTSRAASAASGRHRRPAPGRRRAVHPRPSGALP